MTGALQDRIRALPSRIPAATLALLLIVSALVASALAHPLGNFTINQYARLTLGVDRIDLRYVIDMAEISALQELQKVASGGDGKPTVAELDQALERIAADYVSNLVLVVDGQRVPLAITAKSITLPPGAGGLPTLRAEMNLVAAIPAALGGTVRHLSFEDRNRRERIGWREIVVGGADGTTIVDSSAYGNGLTDELKAYPQDMLAAPLREEAATLSFTRGAAPAGAVPLRTRDGHPVVQARDPVTDLINVPEVTPLVAALGLLVAAGFGALHAFSPGHGKTVVGAYLVGARASIKHAAFLGTTVTVTHTLGVLALGIVTLFASRYILPEQLFPVLSFISGAIVLAMGLSLFAARLRVVRAPDQGGHIRPHPIHDDGGHDHVHHGHVHHDHAHHDNGHHHDHDHDHAHGHTHLGSATFAHSHGGSEHSHLPPGADGGPIRWRSLLALGISGGLLPCPSALVILLSAIALHRVAYGLLLVVAFSFGLAATLTGIGLAFIHAGRWIKRPTGPRAQRIVRLLPAASALVIMLIGAGICSEALAQAGWDVPRLLAGMSPVSNLGISGIEVTMVLVSLLAALAVGVMFRLKRG